MTCKEKAETILQNVKHECQTKKTTQQPEKVYYGVLVLSVLFARTVCGLFETHTPSVSSRYVILYTLCQFVDEMKFEWTKIRFTIIQR